MKNMSILVVSALATTALIGCQSNQAMKMDLQPALDAKVLTDNPYSIWDKTDTPSLFDDNELRENESRVVFVSQGQDLNKSVVVGVNGEFVASMLPNQYATFITCTGLHRVAGIISDNKSKPIADLPLDITLEPRKTQYVLVDASNPNMRVTFSSMSTYYANQKIAGATPIPLKVSNLVKQGKACPSSTAGRKVGLLPIIPVPPLVEVIVPVYKEKSAQVFSLSSDLLFDFDSNKLRADSAGEINKTIRKLSDSYASISYIDVVGHTDRLGSASYNYNLASRRAETVRQTLIEKGFSSKYMTTVSKGETQPVTGKNSCKGMSLEATKSCLAPDRRVELHITGTLTVNETQQSQ